MYTSEHNGHDKALKHVTLSQIERQQIAGMISAGIEFDEILDSIRDNLPQTEITRLHLLKRRDLYNISRDFHLQDQDMNMLLNAGCGSTAPNDKERNMNKIEELINTIRGSLVGDPNIDVIAIAKEALKAAVGQITAANLRPTVQPGTLPPPSQNTNESFNKKRDKQVTSEDGKPGSSKKKRRPRRKPSASESLMFARAWEGQELLGTAEDVLQQFEQSCSSKKSEKS